MTTQHVKNIINSRDPRSTPRYPIEEVFFSHNSTVINNRYSFNYPTGFINTFTENRSIGLRNIHATSPSIHLAFYIRIRNTGDTGWVGDIRTIAINIPHYYTIEEVIYHLKENLDSLNVDPWDILYKPEQNMVRIKSTTDRKFAIWTENASDVELVDSFLRVFNQDPTTINNLPYVSYYNKADSKVSEIRMFNVWNRRNTFFHASFVANTQYNYLCSTNKSISTSMKIYPFNDTSQQFFISVSFNGKDIVPFYQPFIIELTFIFNDKNTVNID